MRLKALILLLTLGAAHAWAADPATAIGEERLGLWHVASLPWQNPAVNQWRMDCGLTRVGAGYSHESAGTDRDARFGRGGHNWSVGADTYTKYRTSTLWGAAKYANGLLKDAVWNETADYDIVYPYILADSIGGDLHREQYSFSGGYADHSGRWAWGAELSYLATLEYRDVDPRPRNVVGTLDAAAGAAYRIAGDYYAGVSFNFRKYKQSNDIDFKSEMGVDKIFHLTGMGTHYRRFAGTALSTYYDGYRYGVGADIYPASGRGFFLSVAMSRFSFDNILSDLNKLPMASAWHKTIAVEAGWLARADRFYGGVSARTAAYRRHGSENVFGDAAAGIFPQIGSNEMYADNGTSAALKGLWGLKSGTLRVASVADAEWQRRVTTYIEPWRHSTVNAVAASLGAGADFVLPHSWLLGAGASVHFYSPFSCDMAYGSAGSDSETVQLDNIEMEAYRLASTHRTRGAARISAAHTVADRYMVQAAAEMRHHDYTFSLSVIF